MTEAQPRVLSDIRELLDEFELVSVHFHEIHARRVFEDRPDEPARFTMECQQRLTETSFEPRFRMIVTDQHADYVLDVSTLYESSGPVTFRVELVREFIEKVGAMAAYPFLREALATSAARLELPVPLLGLLRAGQFQLETVEGDGGEDAPEA